MTGRERLTALLHDATLGASKHPLADYLKKGTEEAIADYLLANGVMCPPVAVGDVVYKPVITYDTHEPVIWDIAITDISIDIGGQLNESYAIGIIRKGYSSISFDFDDIGKTVFLSREEAEKALAERRKEDEGK